MEIPELINSVNEKVNYLKTETNKNALILYFVKALTTRLYRLDAIERGNTSSEDDKIIYTLLKSYGIHDIYKNNKFDFFGMTLVEELLSYDNVKKEYPKFYKTFTKVREIREFLRNLSFRNSDDIISLSNKITFFPIKVSLSKNVVANLAAKPVTDFRNSVYFYNYTTYSELQLGAISQLTGDFTPYFLEINLYKRTRPIEYDTKNPAIPLTKLFEIEGISITKDDKSVAYKDLVGYTVSDKDFKRLLEFYSDLLDIYIVNSKSVTQLVATFDECKSFELVNSL